MILRAAINAVAALFLVVALVTAIAEPGGWPLLLPATVLALGCLLEQWRYRRVARDPPGEEWTRTEERFVDPETGRLTVVYYNPATGGRRYVTMEDAC